VLGVEFRGDGLLHCQGGAVMLRKYRLRYSKLTSGLKNTNASFALTFLANTDAEAEKEAEGLWGSLVAAKTFGLLFLELVEVKTWEPPK
jgi:hypothetical protein